MFLFGIVSKAFTCVFLPRLQKLPKEYIPSRNQDLDLKAQSQDFLCATAAREIQRTERAFVYRFH